MCTCINCSVKWNKVMFWQPESILFILRRRHARYPFPDVPLLSNKTWWVGERLTMVSSDLLYCVSEWSRMFIVRKRNLENFGQFQCSVYEGVCANCSTASLTLSFPFLSFFCFLNFLYLQSLVAVKRKWERGFLQ